MKEKRVFSLYMKSIFHQKKLLQREVFLYADIPERYGYKLISQEKHTKQRDIILRLCFAAGMNLSETQEALQLYEMPILFPTFSRDRILMQAFESNYKTIMDVNAFLIANCEDSLRPCGLIEESY